MKRPPGQLLTNSSVFSISRIIFLSTLFFSVVFPVFAQDNQTIYILPGSRSLRQITTASNETLITLAGNAAVRQGNTYIYGDSIVVNQLTRIAQVFGNVHINDADTVHTYAQYLRYLGNERIAYVKKNVRLTDGKGTLLTDDLDYDLNTRVANYKNGGKVLNGKTGLTSETATYYESTKDVYFKKYVHLTDPKYDIKADSLLYNTQSREARFISPTTILNKDGGAVVKTKNGFYNLQSGKAEFYERTAYDDSAYNLIGDQIAFDEKDGILQVDGKGKIIDKKNRVTAIGDLLYLNKKTKSFLATRKPVMIFYSDNDSTYLAADTLFSGVRLRGVSEDTVVNHTQKLDKDSLFEENFIVDSNRVIPPVDYRTDTTMRYNPTRDIAVKEKTTAFPGSKKRARNTVSEEKKDDKKLPVKNLDQGLGQDPLQLQKTDSVPKKDSLTKTIIDSSKNIGIVSPLPVQELSKPLGNDSIRYFLGFSHVRIYNDSLQAVCDSMYYSTEDSVFRMFKDPVFWNDKSQVTGDTINLFTENQKAKRLYVFNDALIVNEQAVNLYNQVGGKTLDGFFKAGEIDYVQVKGFPAESIFFATDADSAYIGMNRSTSDIIDAYFQNKKLVKVKFIKEVDGTLYPMRMIGPVKELDGFMWLDKRRPKNFLELFE